MALVLPTRIDRATLRMITIKRSVTGTLSIAFALVLLGYGVKHFAELVAASKLYWFAGVVVFGGGGAWSLRDAVRGWKMLRGNVS